MLSVFYEVPGHFICHAYYDFARPRITFSCRKQQKELNMKWQGGYIVNMLFLCT